MKPAGKRLTYLASILWVIGYLIAVDMGINLVFRYPADPHNINPSRMQQFFEYGRSTEGKLARMTRPTDDASAPIVSSGWLESDHDFFLTDAAHRPDKPLIAVYGMSHADRLAQAMVSVDTTIAVRFVGAPGAAASWAFAAYERDRRRVHADVAIFAVMTNGVYLITTTCGSTMQWDFAYPYTYPRYRIIDGQLEEIPPPFESVQTYREYFYNPEKWAEYCDWLAQYDRCYDPFMFRANILDKSSLCRLLRRSYANFFRRTREAEVFENNEFNAASEEVMLLRRLVSEFARSARNDRTIPVLYLVNSLSTGNSLLRILEPVIASDTIACLSSDTICPPDDARYYLPDTHFIPSMDTELARAMTRLIHHQLGR